MNNLDPTALVLVALIPTPRDLEIARVLGWYRIPLVKAPKVVAVDYLAFYQPGSFGENSHRIEYIAAVRGHELTTRGELLRDQPTHPRSHEEYYKIQLGPLEALPAPLPAGDWKRITFFYTTGEELQEAETVSDLVVEGEQRKLLWQSLRERAQHLEIYQSSEQDDYPLPEEILPLLEALAKSKIQEDPSEYD